VAVERVSPKPPRFGAVMPHRDKGKCRWGGRPNYDAVDKAHDKAHDKGRAAWTPLLTTAVSERHALPRWRLWRTAGPGLSRRSGLPGSLVSAPAGNGSLQGVVVSSTFSFGMPNMAHAV